MIILSRLQVRNFKSLRAVDLTFPRQARILVEGLNEAGKSTLFESVYFALYGEPLVAEETGARGRTRHDSAIHYREDQARVELELDVDGTQITVVRSLRRNHQAKAHLRIVLPDGESEELDGARAVTERLIEELGKLDKESLLNSCFVEQKKLSKLEDLSRADRQSSLEHLLNLDKLQALQEEFRVKPGDQQALETARQRWRLAQAQARVPEREAALTDVRRRLVAVDIHDALGRIAAAEHKRTTLNERLAVIQQDQVTIEEQLGQVQAFRARLDSLHGLERMRERIGNWETHVESARAELGELELEERQDLPRLAARQAALTDLQSALAGLDLLAGERQAVEAGIQAANGDLAQIREHEATAARLTGEIAAQKEEIARLQDAVDDDEARANAEVARAEARLAGLRQVAGLLATHRERTAARDLAARELDRVRGLAAEYVGLQQRLATINQELARQEEATAAAAQAFTDSSQAQDQVRRLLGAQQQRERQYDAAIEGAERARVQAAEYAELRNQLAAGGAEQQAREAGVRLAEEAHARARAASTQMQQLADAQQERERTHAAAQQTAEAARTQAGESDRLLAERDAAATERARAADAVASADAAYAAAEQAERTARVARARTLWAQGRRTDRALAADQSSLAGSQDRLVTSEQTVAVGRRTLATRQQQILFLGIAGALGIAGGGILIILGIIAGAALLVLGLAAVALAGRALLAARAAREALRVATQQLETAQQEALKQAAQRAAAAALGSGAARIAEAETELRALGEPIPASLEEVEATLPTDGAAADLAALRSAVTAARNALEAARTAHREADTRHTMLDVRVRQAGPPAGEVLSEEELQESARGVEEGRTGLVATARAFASAGDYPTDADPTSWADPGADRSSLNALEVWVRTRRDALEQARTRLAESAATFGALQVQVNRHPGAADAGATMEAPGVLEAAVRAGRREIVEAVLAQQAAGALPAARADLDGATHEHDADLLAALEAEVERRRAARDAAREVAGATRATHASLAEQIAGRPVARGTDTVVAAEAVLADLDRQIADLEPQLRAAAGQCNIEPVTTTVAAAQQEEDRLLAAGRDTLAAIPARREHITTLQEYQAGRLRLLDDEQSWRAAHDPQVVEERRVALQQQAAALADQHANQTAAVAAQAASLAVAAEHRAVQQALGAAGSEHSRLTTQIAERRPQLLERVAELERFIVHEQAEGQQRWQDLLSETEELAQWGANLPALPALQTAVSALASRIADLDEPDLLARQRDLERMNGEATAQQQQAAAAIAAEQTTIGGLLASQQVAAAPDPQAIAAVFPIFAAVDPADRPALDARREATSLDLEATRRERTTLENLLGLRAIVLDEAECAADVRERQRDLDVRSRAGHIIGQVRTRMIEQVLPHTERNMCLLLPELTLARYRDCQITEDYKLEVWDELAGRYVAKNVFSGGARDQFSLALRLAFALATLPQELGTTPGFIFLDEPLSAFDGPRTQALVELLTHGPIAANFSQIFVISHNRQFDPGAFTHHLRMDGGAIVESDLHRARHGSDLAREAAEVARARVSTD